MFIDEFSYGGVDVSMNSFFHFIGARAIALLRGAIDAHRSRSATESLCRLATRTLTAARPTSKIAIADTAVNDAILAVVTNAMLQNIHAVPKRAQTNAPLARPFNRASMDGKGERLW